MNIKQQIQLKNHPKKGDFIKVEPIRTPAAIKKIRTMLKNKPRDLCLFNLGINMVLRASDLVRIKVGQVRDLKVKDSFEIKEKKAKKIRRISINPVMHKSIQYLLEIMPNAKDNDYLFQGKKASKDGVLTVSYVNMLVKGWCKEIGLKGNYGSHTLRKTFGHYHRTVYGTPLPRLMKIFGHSSQEQTLEYLCIPDEEIENDYMKGI